MVLVHDMKSFLGTLMGRSGLSKLRLTIQFARFNAAQFLENGIIPDFILCDDLITSSDFKACSYIKVVRAE